VKRLEQNILETTDIYRGAFFLCKGGGLHRVRIKDNGKRIASFMIRCEDLGRLDKEYRSGQALVNPLQLRESLNHLRDILFDKLRENERRIKDDRKGKNRRSKKKY
jgi:hypothetical protein